MYQGIAIPKDVFKVGSTATLQNSRNAGYVLSRCLTKMVLTDDFVQIFFCELCF